MKILILSFLIAVVFPVASAFASGECDGRLQAVGRPSYSELVKKSLMEGKISVADAEKLALSERPFNPLADETPKPENTHLIKVFQAYTQMEQSVWLEEREKIRGIVKVYHDNLRGSAVATEETAEVAKMTLTSRHIPGLSNQHMLTNNGEMIVPVFENGEIKFLEIFSDKVLWQGKFPRGTEFTMRLNPETADPEVRFVRYWNWYGEKRSGTAWKHQPYYGWTLNLRTHAVSARSAGVAMPGSQVSSSWWGEGEHFNWKKLRTASGELIQGELEAKQYHPKKLKVYDSARRGPPSSYGAIFHETYPDLPTTYGLFETSYGVWLVVDQMNGLTRLYKPLDDKKPIMELDLTSQKHTYLQLVRDPQGKAYLFELHNSTINLWEIMSKAR